MSITDNPQNTLTLPVITSSPFHTLSPSLILIDISLLSQSELQALSLCSVSARRGDDVVSPQLNRSVFNESAGRPTPASTTAPIRGSSDPVTHSIVHFLKGDHNPPSPPQDFPEAAAAEVGFLGLQENVKLKRNRVRRGGNSENRAGIELQRVNGKGEIVDFVELGENGDELYGDELKRRTAGLETEEAILGSFGGRVV